MKRSKCAEQVKASKQKKINMEANNQNNMMGDLIRAAECIVCLEIPRGSVNCCKNGQILCHSCETKMKRQHHGHAFQCPECRVPFRPYRNFSLPDLSLISTGKFQYFFVHVIMLSLKTKYNDSL